MPRYSLGDRVRVNDSYGRNIGGDHWNGRPGRVIEVVAQASHLFSSDPVKSAIYWVHLPKWNGLPEFPKAIFRETELDPAFTTNAFTGEKCNGA